MHFRDLLETFPFENSSDKFQWSVFIHNKVNERLGKPVISVDKAREVWSHSTQFDFKIIAFILLIALVILFALRK